MMSTPNPYPYGRSSADVRKRLLRERRLRRQRLAQLLILLALVLALTLAGLWAFRQLSTPTDPATTSSSSSASPSDAPPGSCPAPGTLPAEPSEVTVQVLNGTTENGLAGRVSNELEARGFAIITADNTSLPADPVTVVYHPDMYREASAVAAQFDGAVWEQREEAGETVQVLIGEDFPGVAEQDAAQARLTEPIAAPPGC